MDARWWVFDRWPNSATATRLHGEAGTSWPAHQDAVLERLSANPREAVLFRLNTLKDPIAAWGTADVAKMSELVDLELLQQEFTRAGLP